MAWLKWRGSDKRGQWYGSWTETVAGKRRKIWKALSKDRKIAERMLRSIQNNMDLQGAGLAQSVSWKQFRAEYLKFLKDEGCAASTLVRVGIILDHLERIYPITTLMDITPKLMDDYKGARKEEGIEGATINRELGALKAALKQARKWLYQVHDLSDVEKVKVVDKEKISFTNAQIQTMVERADPTFRMIILLGLYAGLRREEMLQLRWTNVDWERRILILGKDWLTKTRKIRYQPIPGALLEALQKWRGVCGGQSERVIEWNHAPHQLSNMFTHFLRSRCGIKEGSLHSLRHSYITRLTIRDVAGAKISRLAGHASTRTTEIYQHLNIEDLREPVDRLDYGLDTPGSSDGSK